MKSAPDIAARTAAALQTPETVARRRDLYWRWVILTMLFIATFLNYFDRQTLSVLKPEIKAQFGLDDNGYAHIVMAFMITYMFAYTLGGRFVDWVGSRISMTLFVGVWSLASLFSGLSRSLAQLTACRVVLGAAEPGNYPAALRATATWFPPQLRGFASGIYQAGSATAAVVAMPIIAVMASRWGWRATFVVPGVLGLAWAAGWWLLYRSPSAAYATHLVAEQGNTSRLPWRKLLRHRNLWGVVLARMVSDQAWYFCLFWMPGYLQENLHFTLMQAGLIGWIPFLCADLGGVLSGILSDRMVARGRPAWQARKRVLVVSAFLAPVAALIPFAPQAWIAIAAFCILAVVCQVWLFSITTLVSDVFPRTSVASVLGISGSFGALGGLISSKLIGALVVSFSFTPVFLGLACLHLISAALIARLILAPRTLTDSYSSLHNKAKF